MTRRDYEKLAAVFREAREDWSPDPDGDIEFAVEQLVERVASVLAVDNPRFDRQRFSAACKP